MEKKNKQKQLNVIFNRRKYANNNRSNSSRMENEGNGS